MCVFHHISKVCLITAAVFCSVKLHYESNLEFCHTDSTNSVSHVIYRVHGVTQGNSVNLLNCNWCVQKYQLHKPTVMMMMVMVMKMGTHLFGTLNLLQEGVQLPGFCVQSPAHCLVVTGGVRQAGQMICAQLQSREWSRGDSQFTLHTVWFIDPIREKWFRNSLQMQCEAFYSTHYPYYFHVIFYFRYITSLEVFCASSLVV